MSQFVTPTLAPKLLRLGHRTHSLVDDTPPPTEPGTISGAEWWPERIIKVTRWPSGDVGVSIVDRKARKALVVAPKRQTGTLSEEDSVRATRRARRQIWRGCQELEANCILTIAKRGGFPEVDEAWSITGEILAEMKRRDWIAGHLTVPEIHDGSRTDGPRHGANLGTWHIHVATRKLGFFDFKEMHDMVRDIERRRFGNNPDNPEERLISLNVGKRPHGKRYTPATIARYLAPYVAKAIEGSPRELHRKRFDISRNREKAQEITIRCEPGETSSPDEIAGAILHALAPGRQFSTPFKQETHGVKFWQQSAVDWGTKAEAPEAFDLPAPMRLWNLIHQPSVQPTCRQANNSEEQVGERRALEEVAAIRLLNRAPLSRAKPDRTVRGRERPRVAGCPDPGPANPDAQPLWDVMGPFLDAHGLLDGESHQP